VWFDGSLPTGQVDVVRYVQRSSPVAGARNEIFATPRVALTATKEALFQSLEKDTRYDIRRAEQRDSARCECPPPYAGGAIAEFIRFYNEFARARGLARLSASRVHAYAAAGALDLSVAKSEAGEPLVWHAYYWGDGIARLLHSASNYRDKTPSERSRIGRVNRLLHWQDMLRLKDRGITCYDLGGWYRGTADQEQLRINDFKKGFGGVVVETYNAESVLTWRGRVFVRLSRLRARTRPAVRA